MLRNLDDLSTMSPEEIARAIKNAQDIKALVEGAGAAELRRRGWAYRQIGDLVGRHHSTVGDWIDRHDAGRKVHPEESPDSDSQPG